MWDASPIGVILEIPPLYTYASNPPKAGTVLDGEFNWGGCLLKCNGGAQR